MQATKKKKKIKVFTTQKELRGVQWEGQQTAKKKALYIKVGGGGGAVIAPPPPPPPTGLRGILESKEGMQ